MAATTTRSPYLFICYRSKDTGRFSRGLAKLVSERYGADRIFLDRQNSVPGEIWRAKIEEALRRATVMVVAIGAKWLALKNGRRRIDDPRDDVYLEISSALRTGTKIIPVFVGREKILDEEDLPLELRPLMQHNAVQALDVLADSAATPQVPDLLAALENAYGFVERHPRIPPLDESTRGTRGIRIAHLSDLHFGRDTYPSEPRGRHSVELLVAAERRLSEEKDGEKDPIHYIVVSGDLSYSGEREECLRARTWLESRMPLMDGQAKGLSSTGLGHPRDKIGVVQGNRDVDKTKLGGSGRKLDRDYARGFLDAFELAPRPAHVTPLEKFPCAWLTDDSTRVFVAFFDSSFCGHGDEAGAASRATRCSLLLKQSEDLIALCDRGLSGNLVVKEERISSSAFQSAIKAVVMHHPLLTTQAKLDGNLPVGVREKLLQNLMHAHIDVVFCGHRHVGELKRDFYAELISAQKAARQLRKEFTHLLLHEKPAAQLRDGRGRRYGRALSLLVTWVDAVNSSRPRDGLGLDHLVSELRAISQDPLRLWHTTNGEGNEPVLSLAGEEAQDWSRSGHSLEELGQALRQRLTEDERQRLNKLARAWVKNGIRVLGKRKLLQIRCASTALSLEGELPPKAARSFNICRFTTESHHVPHVNVRQFAFREGQFHFEESRGYDFPSTRQLVLC
jgi:hypothetical protein